MSFLRHGEIFPSDGAPTLESNAPAHRLDESPVGYSLTGWSPPLPGSASPTKTSILQKGPGGGKNSIAIDIRIWVRKTRNSSVTFLVEATRSGIPIVADHRSKARFAVLQQLDWAIRGPKAQTVRQSNTSKRGPRFSGLTVRISSRTPRLSLHFKSQLDLIRKSPPHIGPFRIPNIRSSLARGYCGRFSKTGTTAG
jgi:hypothetical protein